MERNRDRAKTGIELQLIIPIEELIEIDPAQLSENMNDEHRAAWIASLMEGLAMDEIARILTEELSINNLAIIIAENLDETDKKNLVFAIAKL